MMLLIWIRKPMVSGEDPEEPDDGDYQDDREQQDETPQASSDEGDDEASESEEEEDEEPEESEDGDEEEDGSAEGDVDAPVAAALVGGSEDQNSEPPFFDTLSIKEYGESMMALKLLKARSDEAATKASRMSNAKTPQARTELAEAQAVSQAYRIALMSATHDDFKRNMTPIVREVVKSANAGIPDIKDWVRELYIFGQANTVAYPVFKYS
jgi:hypothetical protein